MNADPHGRARRLNRSLPWLALEAEQLEREPDCSDCGSPATEAHLLGGCHPPDDAAARARLDDIVSRCRDCHDREGCPEPPPPSSLFVGLFGP